MIVIRFNIDFINSHVVTRTDAGVHALNSAVVVDLQRNNGKLFEEDYISSSMNRFFEESKHEIRVNKVEVVPNDFNSHGRVVKSRTYIYRLGIIKPGRDFINKLEESQRCLFLVLYVGK